MRETGFLSFATGSVALVARELIAVDADAIAGAQVTGILHIKCTHRAVAELDVDAVAGRLLSHLVTQLIAGHGTT